jgi:two-component system OmpR family response regulator
MRVLLVEDSERVAQVVSRTLGGSGHVVSVARDSAHARAEMVERAADLAIIDVGLPDGSGLDLCRGMRQAGYDLPILLLTAKNAVDDRVRGLDAGADDYLGKPFAAAELVARVRALGRRGPRFTDSVREFGAVRIDRDHRVVYLGGEPAPLTAREFEIVAALAWRDGRVIPRDEILELVWGDPSDRASGSLDVLVARIRRKLGRGASEDAIRTVRNVGYAWALARSKRP